MKTVNSLSGGKTSSYLEVHYPADYSIFSLIRTDDKSCIFPDKKIRQMVSDRIGCEFIGTLEMDEIIYTMLDLEQFTGRKITWLSPMTFDDLVYSEKTDKVNMPNMRQRSCTFNLKVRPIEQFWFENISDPIEMRIRYRANKQSRALRMIEKTNENGFSTSKIIIGKHKNGNNKWKELEWRKPSFPLIEDRIFKDTVEEYWKDKPVRFAYKNNCVGCFERNEIFLNHMYNKCPNKFEWFNKVEKKALMYKKMTWKEGITYEKIKNHKMQLDLFDEDFNECDSGYCGL